MRPLQGGNHRNIVVRCVPQYGNGYSNCCYGQGNQKSLGYFGMKKQIWKRNLKFVHLEKSAKQIVLKWRQKFKRHLSSHNWSPAIPYCVPYMSVRLGFLAGIGFSFFFATKTNSCAVCLLDLLNKNTTQFHFSLSFV